MGQKSNIPLLNVDSIFTWLTDATGLRQSTVVLVIGAVVVALLIWALYWFFGTEMGAALRATGNNEDMIRALGVNVKVMKVLALAISNGLVGLSGALYCQSSKVGDIQMGTGTIVIGLAAIVIGEVLVGKKRAFGTKLLSAVLGSIVFFIIRAVVMWFRLWKPTIPNWYQPSLWCLPCARLCFPPGGNRENRTQRGMNSHADPEKCGKDLQQRYN